MLSANSFVAHARHFDDAHDERTGAGNRGDDALGLDSGLFEKFVDGVRKRDRTHHNAVDDAFGRRGNHAQGGNGDTAALAFEFDGFYGIVADVQPDNGTTFEAARFGRFGWLIGLAAPALAVAGCGRRPQRRRAEGR
jgi:hypothetical protein